jgi:hypothetical protein
MDKPSYPIYSYPRTPHLDFSPGATSDDKYASPDTLAFLQSGVEIITTEKMDGGNLSLYRDYFHGRSLDSGTHSWDTFAKQIWSEIRFDIPEGWRISCESMYARRSVAYENLASPLYIIGIWDDKNTLLSWDDTVIWAELLGLPSVPLLYRGTDYKKASKVWFTEMDDEKSEGFVIRNAGAIPYEKFGDNIAKWVRANHVRTAADWRHRDDFALNTFVS